MQEGVDGFSLGGYASTLYAFKHPGVFSSVGSYDGTIMWHNLDDPATPGPLDDRVWYNPSLVNFFAPAFDQPLNPTQMQANSATNILMEANLATIDSIQQISFHITSGAFSNSSNRNVNEQLLGFLADKGISNSFDNLLLASNATHTWDWADEHANRTLIKHWETFTSLSCSSLNTGINNIDQSSQSIKLFQNSPNPVYSLTNITFELLERKFINISIFDAMGRKIRTLVHQSFSPGRHQIHIDMSELANGIYFLSIGKAILKFYARNCCC